mmetsp:Transcript_41526/g.106221  ORF Transcript_41526/g.106221 Transcript_41526/m.106221 type:complete len:206 (-) Transcript_41526:2608-3225(-)
MRSRLWDASEGACLAKFTGSHFKQNCHHNKPGSQQIGTAPEVDTDRQVHADAITGRTHTLRLLDALLLDRLRLQPQQLLDAPAQRTCAEPSQAHAGDHAVVGPRLADLWVPAAGAVAQRRRHKQRRLHHRRRGAVAQLQREVHCGDVEAAVAVGAKVVQAQRDGEEQHTGLHRGAKKDEDGGHEDLEEKQHVQDGLEGQRPEEAA